MATATQRRRRATFAGIAALVAWGLYEGLRPQPVEMDLAAARRGRLEVSIEQEGRTRVADRYVITAPIDGYARRIALDVGDAVRPGMTLVELEPLRAEVLDPRRRAEAQARIAAAIAAVSVAEQRTQAAASDAALAQKELQRTRALRATGHVSQAAEDRATSEAQRTAAEVRSAQFAVAAARHELDAARAALKYAATGGSVQPVAIRAEVPGRVLKVPRRSEGTVAAGQPLLEIGDPRALEVEVDVLSTDAVRIAPGTRVLFERWGGEGVLEGVVRVIEPAGFTKVSALGVEEQRVWVIVDFTSPAAQWQRLGDGYRVEARFIIWEGADVLQIPAGALFREGDGWAAYAVEDGKAVRRRIEVGQRSGLAAQVISGIREGETVIVHPDDRVRHGIAVTAR